MSPTNRSEFLLEFAKALNNFQGAMRSVPKTSVNPFFHSKYASLDAVWDMCRKPLADNGFSVVQTTVGEEGKLFLDTLLLHISGEYISCRYPLTPMRQTKDAGWALSDDPQSIGSAITYARRYAMSAMLGISADEDDDAEKATGKRQPAPSKKDTTATGEQVFFCAEHQVAYIRHEKEGRVWYSHKTPDGKYHNFTAPTAPQMPQDDPQDAPEPAVASTTQGEASQKASGAAEFTGTTFGALWNYGMSLGFKGGKPDCLKALAGSGFIKAADDSLIADLADAAVELKRIAGGMRTMP